MFITPMEKINGIGSAQGFSVEKEQSAQSASFTDIFKNTVENVKKSEEDLSQAEYMLATGQIDDAHTVPALMAKAQLATDLLVSVKTQALAAYNELIKISG